MPGAYTLEWRDGRKEDRFGHRGFYYVFQDGTILSFSPEPAWCHNCNQIRLCEPPQDQAALRQELLDLEDPNSKSFKTVANSTAPNFAAIWKKTLEVQLRHAVSRKLPPSCIYCGHRQIAYFSDDWAPHPGTGEEVRFYCSGMCSTTWAGEFYDVDCNPLNISEAEKSELWEKITRRDEAY